MCECHRWSIIGVSQHTSPRGDTMALTFRFPTDLTEAHKAAVDKMSYDEFQVLIDGYIERSSRQTGEMPASVFFELLFERLAARARRTIKVTGHIVDRKLVLSLPRPETTPVQVQGNQIFVGDQRIVVRLETGWR